MKNMQLHKLAACLTFAGLTSFAAAQSNSLPVINILGYNAVYEGNGPDRRGLRFDFTLSAPSRDPVTFLVSTVQSNGGLERLPATPGVDYVEFRNYPMTIYPGQTSTFLTVGIIGDSQVEPDEALVVQMSNIVGARTASGTPTLAAPGEIYDDDGPPVIWINDISVSEPLTSSRSATFTVRLEYPYRLPVSVNFATRNGTATANGPIFPGGPIILRDYASKSGVLTIPENTETGTITVSLTPDFNQIDEPDETFFVDLSNAVNGNFRDRTGVGTILDSTPLTLGFVPQVGGFQISPDLATPVPGETVFYSIIWEVPEGEVWRDLRTIDFRIRDKKKTALWVRWDEASNLFVLLNTPKAGKKGDGKVANASRASGIVGSPGDLPGSNMLLEGALAELDLAESSVVGSGPTGKTVTLNLAVRFLDKAEGRSFDLELAATDDFLNEDGFIQAGEVEVERIVPCGPK